MVFNQLAIVGVGLLGGSVGLAAKARIVAKRIIGVGRTEESLRRAKQRGAIDDYSTSLPEAVLNSDLVVVCTPVDRVADDVVAALLVPQTRAMVTDVGSTKSEIVARIEVEAAGHASRFVGSHPLAGSEKQGVDYADADLFRQRTVILTPTGNTSLTTTEAIESFWESLGAICKRMTPREHDDVVAITSHLPHAVAAGLAGTTPLSYLAYTAGGFRDTTRIAAGDPELWSAIFEANRDAVLDAVDRLTNQLHRFRSALANQDRSALVHWLAEGKRVRDALGS
jgi:prephenate dehydrogenase